MSYLGAASTSKSDGGPSKIMSDKTTNNYRYVDKNLTETIDRVQ